MELICTLDMTYPFKSEIKDTIKIKCFYSQQVTSDHIVKVYKNNYVH